MASRGGVGLGDSSAMGTVLKVTLCWELHRRPPEALWATPQGRGVAGALEGFAAAAALVLGRHRWVLPSADIFPC